MLRFPPPKLFSYDKIIASLSVAAAIPGVEACFASLAQGKVDVPMPMHIGIPQSPSAGPGDCHIKGGYIEGMPTFTVKLATVSFYNNAGNNLPPGAGVFAVMSAVNGSPLGLFMENRFMTDLRTGAAGAVSLKHFLYQEPGTTPTIGFIGCGAIAKVMARGASAIVPGFKAVAFAPEGSQEFAEDIRKELGIECVVVGSAEELCGMSDAIYTQTPGGKTVLETEHLRPHATIIASGSDQPTKNELPVDLLASAKYISDLTKQTSRLGELRSAIEAGVMTEKDVYAEIGEVVAGMKPGRTGKEMIVVDLTGTGAQDAAIGQVAWDLLKDDE